MGRRDKMIHAESFGALPLGARLRRVRQSKGISLTKMAELTKYSKSYLSTVENSSTPPSKDLIQVYERVLDLAPGELTNLLYTKSPFSFATVGNASVKHGYEREEERKLPKIPFDETLLIEPGHFVGRHEDSAWLMERLRKGGIAGITALRGLGGIGKTSLAAVVIRKLRSEGLFPDGIAVVLCEALKEPAEILQSVLSRFDPQPQESETKNFADLSKFAYQLLHGKEVLIVLDNIPPELAIEQVVAPLRAAGATLLLTSRQILPYNAVPTHAVRKIELLSFNEALDLFVHLLGKKDLTELSEADRDAAQRIITTLDRHTLAVKLSGIYAVNLGRDLEALADLLEDPQKAFESVEDELPQSVKRIFDHSLESLPPQTQWLFSAFSAFKTVEFSRNAAIALLLGLYKAFEEANTNALSETHINILVRQSLIDPFVNEEMPRKISDRERLRLHPVLRSLAVSQFEKWPEEEQHIAYHAIAQYYTHYALRLLDNISDPDEIAITLDSDRTNMTVSLEWAYMQKDNAQVMIICSALQYVWNYQSNTNAILRYLPWGIDSAEKIIEESPEEQLRALQCLARLTSLYGHALQLTSKGGISQGLEQARHYYEKSLSAANTIGNQEIAGVTLYRLGRLFRKLGNLGEAEKYYEKALPVLREEQNRRDEGWTLAFLGQIKHDQGNLQEAEDLYKKALAIHHSIRFRRGEGWIIGYLGRLALTYHRLGDVDGHQLDSAEKYYREYLEIAEQQQDRHSRGICFSFLGEIALAKKQYDAAEKSLTEAMEIQHEVHDTQSEGWALYLLGQLALEQKNYQQAEVFLYAAAEKLGAVNDVRAKKLILELLSRIPQAL